jgi:hypothetical protein
MGLRRGLDSKTYMARQQSPPILQTPSPRSGPYRFGSEGSNGRGNCTLIETIQGEVKLIKRSNDLLEALRFPNLKDCLEYIDRNKLHINIIHRGKRRETEKDNPDQ